MSLPVCPACSWWTARTPTAASCAARCRREGYRVWDAADGAQAAAVLREHADEIDVALISCHLLGLATAEALRAVKPGLACCLVGGGVEPGQQPAACTRVLAKPYSVKDVVELLRSLRVAGAPR